MATALREKPASTPAELEDRTRYRRAVETVIWGMPAVNFDLMYQAALRVKDAANQIIYWSRLPSWKNQTLTPNPDAIYLMPFIDTKDVGPVVLEIPPADDGSITGSIDDSWQRALEDVGPAGADQGQGGKYLILPPDYKSAVPSDYIALPCGTYQSYALLRSILKDGSETGIAKAVAYGKRIKLYPLAQGKNQSHTTFVDTIDDLFDSTIPYDVRFFRSLDRIVQYEPWLTRDKAMIDQLKSLGVEKGKSFNPDAAMEKIFEDAAGEARAWIDAQRERLFTPPYFQGTHWAVPANPAVVEGMSTNFAEPDTYPVDGRAVTYSMGYFSAKHLGAGQYYLMTLRDKQGRSFDGVAAYRLTVPPNAPVNQYWSATAYDRSTHALIRDVGRGSRSSQNPDLQKNADGSVDVYFAPKPPAGRDSNWIPTRADGSFEVLFRFYGPEKALFDKTWKLPDIEQVP